MPGEAATRVTARQIAAFLARYDPAISRLASDARARLRERMPTAMDLVYDNYNALVFGYGPNERASEAIISLALYPRWVNLFFLQGAKLPDPAELLLGSGAQVRRIRLHAAGELETPAIRTLLSEAIDRSPAGFAAGGRGVTIIKSVPAKQRPRR